MIPASIEAQAEALYNACPTVKPAWSELGDVTKAVWLDYARQGKTVADYTGPFKDQPHEEAP